jgi:hypothetical protein
MNTKLPAGIRVGYGLIMGAALGTLFMPIYGPLAIAMGTGLGVLFGAVLEALAEQRR